MLKDIAGLDAFKFMLIAVRLGTAMMYFPALGGTRVTPRTRLSIALAVSFLLLPILAPVLPPPPNDAVQLILVIGSEAIIGLYFGLTLQLLMSALDLAGNYMGYSVGLTNALISDPVTEQQSQLISGILNLAAVTLILITNAHHVMLAAVVDSYTIFKPGAPLMMGDFANQMVTTLSASLATSLKLVAPLLVFSIVFNAALGLLNRLVPQMQVFFVGMPIQILGGLALLALCLPVILMWFLGYFTNGIAVFTVAR